MCSDINIQKGIVNPDYSSCLAAERVKRKKERKGALKTTFNHTTHKNKNQIHMQENPTVFETNNIRCC
jgi:hypothetical protein